MTFHTLDNLFGQLGHPPPGIPTIGISNVQILARYLQDACNLGIEGRTALVPNAGIAQIHMPSVIIVEHAYLGGIGIIAAGS